MGATVTFPQPLTTKDSWTWLHSEADGTVTRTADGALRVEASDIRTGQYLDLVAMVDRTILPDVERRGAGDAKARILADEARQESAWRDQEHRRAIARLVIWSAIAATGLALGVTSLVLALRTRRRARYRGDLDYWREPPTVSPGGAAVVYQRLTDHAGSADSRELAATMMALAAKGVVAIYPGPRTLYLGLDLASGTPVSKATLAARNAGLREGKFARALRRTTTVALLAPALAMADDGAAAEGTGSALSGSERALLRILLEARKRLHSPVFDLKQMGKALEDWKEGASAVAGVSGACGREAEKAVPMEPCGHGAVAVGVLAVVVGVLGSCFIVLGSHNLWVALAVGLPVTALGVLGWCLARRHAPRDPRDAVAGQVLGLARYLEDFGDFTDRDTPDLVLWGQYLVYATAFGISGTVVERMRAACPRFDDEAWLDDDVLGTSLLVYWSLGGHGAYAVGGLTGGNGGGAGAGAFTDLGSQLSSGFASLQSTLSIAGGSGISGGMGGSSFGGSFGGSGGGSFGGR